MPPPYEVRKAKRSEYLLSALAQFHCTSPEVRPLWIETVWYQDWTLEQILKANNSNWAGSTGVYFFSDYCTESDPEGEYVDKRFSFFSESDWRKTVPLGNASKTIRTSSIQRTVGAQRGPKKAIGGFVTRK